MPCRLTYWHPVVSCDEWAARRVVGARLLGEDIVVWVGPTVGALPGRTCACTGTRLSLLGRVDGGTLQCPYHGWIYGAEGQCGAHPGAARRAATSARRASRPTVRSSATASFGSRWVSRRTQPPFPREDAGFRKLLCGPYAGGRQRPSDRGELPRRRPLPVRARERPARPSGPRLPMMKR